MKPLRQSSIDTLWKSLFSLTLIVYAAVIARSVLVPLVFSFFFAIILTPVVGWFQRKKINLALSTLLTMLATSLITGFGIYYLIKQAKLLFEDLPNLALQFNEWFAQFENYVTNTLGISANEQLTLVKENANQLISSSSSIFGDALQATSNLIAFFTLIPIYVFFILIYKKTFRAFLVQLDRNGNDSYLRVAKEIKEMLHNYIGGLVIVIAIVALLNSIGLLALGLEYAIFMGVVSAILTIIPYIGIFIGGLLPVTVALITKDSLIYPILVIAIIGIVQFLEGNFITPKIIGSKVNVNPLAAIIALVIGGQIWGIPGMILAIPLTGIVKIILDQFNNLKPFATLLQNEESKT